jgi:hypothetical protein
LFALLFGVISLLYATVGQAGGTAFLALMAFAAFPSTEMRPTALALNIQLYRWFPSILKVLTIIRPETLVRWHRAGFLSYWRWKSRRQGGRPEIDTELRALIRRMSTENPLWDAPRIHGELLKLGFEVAQSSVAKYMVKRRGPPARDGEPSCLTTRRTLPPWTCSSFQLSASTCSMSSSSFG